MMMSPQTPASSKGKAPSAAAQDSTPPSRLALTNSLSDPAKKRVCDKDPNKNRCLVENCYEERAVDFAHVCPKWFANREDEMDSIEWYWNMARQTLNLDTRWNIMRLGSSIHRLFDKFSWVLVPEESIVDQYYNSLVSSNGQDFFAIRERFPDIPNKDSFKYTLIPIDRRIMAKIALLRQNDPPKKDSPTKDPPKKDPSRKDPSRKDPPNNDPHRNNPTPNHPPPNDPHPLPKPLTPNDFVVHTYPFDTMPVLKSHVHPKFAILEAGLAISTLIPEDTFIAFSNHFVLRKLSRIYQAWKAPRPPNWMEDLTYNLPSPDPGNSRGSEADSEYTEPKRNQPQKRRRHQDVPETPTPAAQTQRASGSGTQGKQRALERDPSICLSRKSLELHDRVIGTGNWTPDSVQEWSETCRPLPEAAHTPWIQLQTGICV